MWFSRQGGLERLRGARKKSLVPLFICKKTWQSFECLFFVYFEQLELNLELRFGGDVCCKLSYS